MEQNIQTNENVKQGMKKDHKTFGQMIFSRFVKHKLAMVGVAIIGLIVLMTIVSFFMTSDSGNTVSLLKRFRAPSFEHWMGTDELGRDVFSRIVAGGKISISLGFTVSIFSILIGTFMGSISGYFGGILDSFIMRSVDFLLALPRLPILLIVATIIGTGFSNMVVVLVIFSWMGTARIVRAQVLSLKEQEFVLASRALGVKTSRILIKHIIPNTLAPIIVAASLQVAGAILQESFLSYLGMGIQPPTPSWGNMLMNARQYLTTAPWLAIWPGLCIFLTILAFNFIGDGLRDAFDPKLKGR